MAAEVWYDGTWNDWRWRTQITGVPRVHRPLKLDGRGTAGDGIRLGQTRVGYNGIRPLTPPAMIHGSMVANVGEEAKPKKNRPMSGAGDGRREPGEPQAAVEKEFEEERINEYKPQRDDMLTAIPRAGALQAVVPLHQRQSGACSAQGGGGPRGK